MDKPLVTTAGVDGYRKGWVAAVRRPGDAVRLSTFPTIAELASSLPDDASIVVDIPIGHPNRIAGNGRVAEQEVRPLLKRRRSSVFSMPARAVVELAGSRTFGLANILEAHRSASALAATLSDPPRKIPIQSFSILPKVREVDLFLASDPRLRERIVESHPEVAFAVLNDGREMEHGKKSQLGRIEREAVLSRHGIPTEAFDQSLPGVPHDDRLDALVMLLIADRHALGLARPYPNLPHRDEHGLPIAIWA